MTYHIVEEIKHPAFSGIYIQVLEPTTPGAAPWNIVSLDVDHFEIDTPQKLKTLGTFLHMEADRIMREYKANGKKREP